MHQNMRGRAIGAYDQIQSAGPDVQLLIAIFNGLLDRLELSRSMYHQGQVAQSIEALGVVGQVLWGLRANIDDRQAPMMADNLRQFFDINMMAVSGLIANRFEQSAYDGAITRLTLMRDSWVEASHAHHHRQGGGSEELPGGGPGRADQVV